MNRRHMVARLFRKTFTTAWESVLTWFVIAIAVAAVAVLFVVQNDTVNALRDRNGSQQAQILQANGRYDQLLDLYKQAYKESQDGGVTPSVPNPTTIPDKATSGGIAGAAGAKGSDGRGIVAAQCTGSGLEVFYSDGSSQDVGTCVGPAGPTGTAGKTGATGLAGIPGTAGAAGQNGADSTVPGPTGATGSSGPAGQDGKNGTDGKDGRSISSTTCNPDGTWLIVYSDGSSQTTDGPCRVDVTAPPPTEPAG